MNFWEVVKEMSAQPVRHEARRLFVLGLAGEPEHVAAAREAVLGSATPEQRAAAEQYLCAASPPYDVDTEKRLRYADVLVSLPGGPEPTELRPADTLQIERVSDLKREVLLHRPDLRVALGRQLPGFRDLAADLVIKDVSRVNAECAAISTITRSLPVLIPWFPIVAGADIFLLTKNQAILMFRLGAIYGEELDMFSRAREVGPVIGGAFGWRTIARELAGVLPGAMGLPVRAAIAYSGTYAVGRAAQMVFDQGRRPTRQEMVRIYEEGRDLAMEVVVALRERFRKEKPAEPALKALPPGEIIREDAPNVTSQQPEMEESSRPSPKDEG